MSPKWIGPICTVLFIVVWEVALRASGIVTDSLAPPTEVVVSAVGAFRDGSMLAATGETLAAAAIGLLIGAGAGALAGVLLGLFTDTARWFGASIEVLRPLPSVALIPLSLMAFGFGYSMELAIIAFATFWPTLVLAKAAVSGVDRLLLEVSRALELRGWQRIVKVVLPAAMPRLLVALRLAIGISLVVAVTVEIAANPQGLGYGLVIAQQSLHPDLMIAFLLWIGILGWGINRALIEIERRLIVGGGEARRRSMQ
jgi:NitT/TauT family transport system permease protein